MFSNTKITIMGATKKYLKDFRKTILQGQSLCSNV